jgi:hypothetical protein
VFIRLCNLASQARAGLLERRRVHILNALTFCGRLRWQFLSFPRNWQFTSRFGAGLSTYSVGFKPLLPKDLGVLCRIDNAP